VFSTEREKNDGIRYEAKRKKVAEAAMSEATTEETTEQEEQEEKSSSESSDEEETSIARPSSRKLWNACAGIQTWKSWTLTCLLSQMNSWTGR
jgi:hypothetical protein